MSYKEFFFIKEDKWRIFAELLTVQPVICKDGVAMYGHMRYTGKSNAQALCKLCQKICKEQDRSSLWDDFIQLGCDAKRNGL